MLMATAPAFAADVATCTLSADKKTVTGDRQQSLFRQVMACEVTAIWRSRTAFRPVVCVKPGAGRLEGFRDVQRTGRQRPSLPPASRKHPSTARTRRAPAAQGGQGGEKMMTRRRQGPMR